MRGGAGCGASGLPIRVSCLSSVSVTRFGRVPACGHVYVYVLGGSRMYGCVKFTLAGGRGLEESEIVRGCGGVVG